ncbi:MAG TPA: HAMP domain-containing sensor histidine kinase [Phycisphaerae bacterium]|nr:HAMP domain-containing sensor histidine kinase [Phycisphaerae bacterium]
MVDKTPDMPFGPAAGSPGRGALTITDRELFDRLGWFTHVRWAFGMFCLLLLLASWHVLGVRFRIADGPWTMGPAVEVVLILFLYNAMFTFLGRALREKTRITRKLIATIALAQIFCDLVAISALIHYTGGVNNAFLLLILVPIAIVSELLPRRLAYAAAGAAAVLIHALAWGENQGLLEHVHVELAGAAALPADLHADAFHVLHVTTALTVTIFAMVFVTTTIAARLRAREAELGDAYDTLYLTDEAKGFFMRRAEHEIRAPLAAIHSILDAIAAQPQSLTDAQLRLIDRAKERAKGLRQLVSDMRRYSRLRSTRAFFETRNLCFSDLVIDTVDLFAKQAEARRIALDSSVTPTWVEGEEERLRELVTNLVSNAVQYTPPGGRVDVELNQQGRHAVLTVKDTGIGISEKAKARLFDEFYRSPEAKNVFPDGSGLGLAIAKRVVEMHHGRIEAGSRPEGGAVFTVHLPLSPESKGIVG